MRLPLIPSQQLSPNQRSLHDDMQKRMKSNFNAFRTMADAFNVPVPERE